MSEVEKLERDLIKAVRQLRIANSLLFLNLVLAAQRGEIAEPKTQALLARHKSGAPPFVVHLIAKYLMQHGRTNTAFALDASNFPWVLHCAFQLAISDPLSNSSDAAVHSYTVRMMSQQMSRQIIAQSYGLALGLFQDLDAVAGPRPIDVRREVEDAINMPVELFMRLGQAAHGATCATLGTVQLRGTLNLEWLAKAAIDIPNVPWTERWADFARVTAVDQKEFNARVPRCSIDEDYGYSFTPLRRHPLIQIAADRFVAVDPHLIVERTSWGVFYDIFERYRKARNLQAFTVPFGFAFERFVDKLLQSVIPVSAFWRETESHRANQIKTTQVKPHQIGDLAYRSWLSPVLIEVTSSRPTREFCTLARTEDVLKAAERMASEVRQCFEHIDAIQSGIWADEGLVPGPWVGLVVTFGRFETINSVFFRNLIGERLGGEADRPYLVLSLAELDCVVKLVEDGKDFGAVIAQLAAKPSFDPLISSYKEEVQNDAVSSFSQSRTARMYDFLPQGRDGSSY